MLKTLMHLPEFSSVWSEEEQAKLNEVIRRYSHLDGLLKYLFIAGDIETKSVRDVVFRIKWMEEKKIVEPRTSPKVTDGWSSSLLEEAIANPLLTETEEILKKVTQNHQPEQLQENVKLLCKARDNIQQARNMMHSYELSSVIIDKNNIVNVPPLFDQIDEGLLNDIVRKMELKHQEF